MAYHVEMMTMPPQKMPRDSGRWLLLLMLLLLHGALWLGVASIWSRPFLLAHLGIFLLWQPLWRGESQFRPGRAVFIVTASVVAVWWLNWWVIAFWVSGLFALIGGRVFLSGSTLRRWRYLLVMAYLLAVLVLWVVPQLFKIPVIAETMQDLLDMTLPLLLLGIALIPDQRKAVEPLGAQSLGTQSLGTQSLDIESPSAESLRVVDFIYSLLLFLLVILLVLGSLAFMTLANVDYLGALFRTLLVTSLALFILGWLWSPRLGFIGLGFTGLQPVFSRYLLNIGSPFEVWLNQLAQTAQQQASPDIFLTQALQHLAALPWLTGLSWVSDEGSGKMGASSPHYIEVVEQDLRLVLFSRNVIAPSVALHMHLLTRLLGHFYQARRREQKLREVARLQAIYETGSRLTHDLKNMLQSLLALISIAQHREQEAVPLLRRQLPVLTQRIELALAKLKAPVTEEEAAMMPLTVWWEMLRVRYADAGIEWLHEAEKGGAAGESTELIPSALFDCVADNLISNANNKRQREPDITIRINLRDQPFSFSICDNGSPLPETLARQVLHSIVSSEDGFGVGLYQAARWAQQLGYKLIVRENVAGKVCFELLHQR